MQATDKLLRMQQVQQVHKSSFGGLCTYQACKQASSIFTVLSDLNKLVKLGGLNAIVPNVAVISLIVCCKALKVTRVSTEFGVCWVDTMYDGCV